MKLTTRIVIRRAWTKDYEHGFVTRGQYERGLRAIRRKTTDLLPLCEDALTTFAAQRGYGGPTGRAKRRIVEILRWLVERAREVDWIALARVLVPIILLFV
jgi:hypothetical protein